jgi:hypothetical protein
MENTNLKGLVDKGQPQGLSNKIVTYDGLSDFLEMLKVEIPRMGYNNIISGPYSYAFGQNNNLNGKYGLIVGSNNEHEITDEASHDYIFGSGNKVKGKFIAIIGKDNGAKGTDGNTTPIIGGECIFIAGQGHEMKGTIKTANLTVLGNNNITSAGIQKSKIIGDGNTIGYGFSHLQGGDDDAERIGHYENNYYILGF